MFLKDLVGSFKDSLMLNVSQDIGRKTKADLQANLKFFALYTKFREMVQKSGEPLGM